MAVVFENLVTHNLEQNNYFEELEEIDKIYYKIVANFGDPSKNYKQFIIQEPRIKDMVTPYLNDLFLEEMRYDNFHNLTFIEVPNKEFWKRKKKYKLQKIRYFYQDKFITLYFNMQSKLQLIESDFIVNLSLYSAYPTKGLNNFLLQPCQKEGSMFSPPPCWTYQWVIASQLISMDDFSTIKDYMVAEWWGMSSIENNVATGSPVLCYEVHKENVLNFERYFHIQPGERDYLLECFTIEYVGNMEGNQCKYFTIDRTGKYFKERKPIDKFKNSVVEKYNNQETKERLELYYKTEGCRKVSARKVDIKINSFEELFFKLGFSWIGRHNAFYYQWNNYMEKFNFDTKHGFYCPPKYQQLLSAIPKPPAQIDPPISPECIDKDSDTLINSPIEYTPKEFNIKELQDIKIFSMEEICFFNINTDKYSFNININSSTLDNFLFYVDNF